MLISAFTLVGCSGTEPRFIYTADQFNATSLEVEKLVLQPIQKYLAGQPLTDADKANIEKALPLIDEMIRWDPVTINSYSLKGKCLRAVGRPAEAQQAFLDGLATAFVRPDNVQDAQIRGDLYLELANLHYAAGELDAASNAASKSLDITSTAAAHVVIAQVLTQRKDYEAAKEECLKALLADADYEPARVLFRFLTSKSRAGGS